MDKTHPERASVSPISPGSPTASHASSSASISSAHKTHGVQKFCSKIRHKIEDNIAPRLTGKLYKSHKHSISMSSLSIAESTSGKYTAIGKQSTLPTLPAKKGQDVGAATSPMSNAQRRITGMLKHQRQRISKSTKTLSKREISAPIGKVATNSGIICPALEGKGGCVNGAAIAQASSTTSMAPSTPYESGTYVDSDEEYQLSLSLTKQSLEDEIFEELEKAAHDESALNAVLKNFDRLLTDYNGDPVVGEVKQTTPHVECDVAAVEAAAAVQLELLALEPPIAFADGEIERQEDNKDEEKTDGANRLREDVTRALRKTSLDTTETFLEPVESTLEPNNVSTTAVTPQEVLESEGATALVEKFAELEDKPADAVAAIRATSSHPFPTVDNENSSTVTTAATSNTTSPSNTAVTATETTTDHMTPPQLPVGPKRLEKSKSSLAIPRRNVYQSPDTPTLRNIRYALATRARSKSVWELTPNSAAVAANSKIPIFKALPLQKRSNSFCSTSLTEVVGKEKLPSRNNSTVAVKPNGVGMNGTPSGSKDIVAAPNSQRRQLTKEARSASALSLAGNKSRSRSVSTTRSQAHTPSTTLIQQQQTQTVAGQRGKRKSLPSEKLTRTNSRLQMERTKSSIGFNSGAHATMSPRRTPSSTSLSGSPCSGSVSRATTALNSVGARKLLRSRDELLDKCLEKGQEILRKVESINTEGGMRKTTMASSKAGVAAVTASSQSKRAGAPTVTAPNARTKVKTAGASSTTQAAGKLTKDACSTGTLRRTRVSNTTTSTAAASPAMGAVTATKQLKYANEEKVPQPQLEFCKIIPPVLGETSDKHIELLVNVVQAKLTAPPSACKTTGGGDNGDTTQQLSQHQATTNSGKEQHATKVATPSYEPLQSAAHAEKLGEAQVDERKHNNNNESDSDDSGHISNENDTTIHTLSTSTTSSVSLCESDLIEEEKVETAAATTAYKAASGKSTKISELLEKFEKQSLAAEQCGSIPRSTPTKVCTATRVAQLEAVQCIQTQVEFYPTYSKEVTIRLL
ncbi:putative GPI-anchored protein pfl2 [Rhagoletis pomonella]|uniref:putative GPI-anchored protein pfl2 n=1 Tax=Rhagoletis pomonella TaxID=28610 RepID=UPI00178044DB|nr:putative GPI-anchored protein pfl2 [Rhagoletis pomonella]XP_036343926.1 putative GPI-anchored protein pfl2 [Rhagoletis pomonella]